MTDESTAKTFEGEGLASFFKKKALLDQAARQGTALRVELDRLDDNPFQPRGEMDEAALEELVASIERHGLLQSITVRRVGDRFQIIAGHRRAEAFKLLRERASERDRSKFASVPAQERVDVTDAQMALYALVENLQRDDLDPVEAASGLAKYQEGEQLSVEELAERTGLEVRRVHRLLQLHTAPPVVRAGVSRGIKVPVLDSEGQPVLTPSGRERFEHRKLDLIAALEISRLARHWERADAAEKVAKRTEALIQRALRDGWTFRRIQEHCQAALKGREPGAPGAAAARFAFRNDEKQLVVYRARLRAATAEARAQLRSILQGLLAEIA
jgi:ParB/RepB/Spo0J family partition protein